MTIASSRNSALPVFRKPAFAALLLSVTMLAGCATNKTPQFSYDADVPALPVVPTAVTDDRPRPLHTPPAWTVARGGTAAGTPAGRVENANAAARVEPRREGYYVRRQGFWDNRRRELTEALVHQVCHIRPLHLDEASGAV